MKNYHIFPMLDLQLFAEGAGGTGAGAGDGGTAQGTGVAAPAAGVQKGVKNPLADVKYGIQEEAPAAGVQTSTTAVPDRNAEFEALIKGQYKDLYDARVQDTIRRRLKGPMETVDKYNALQPILEILGKKHGVDAADIEALTKAIEEDDSYFEQEALEKNMTVQQLKEFKRIERENAELKAVKDEQRRQEEGRKLYAAWMEQAEATKQIYPSFDLKAEMDNPKFLELLRSNIDVRTAYEVTHKDEIIGGAMQFTAKAVEKKLASKIASGGTRPTENGMSSQSAAVALLKVWM